MSAPGRAAVFVDRDGTVITDADYLSDPERVTLLPGVEGAIRRLRAAGYPVVLVTNQGGIARGLYTESDYRAVAARLDHLLRGADAAADATYFCPHHPDFDGPCECRKPRTGLYLRAARDHGIEPAASWYVGDKISDVLPARTLGGRGILVRTGYGAAEEARLPAGFQVADDLGGAVDLILRAGPEAPSRGSGVDSPGAPDTLRKPAENRNDRAPFGYPITDSQS